MASMEVAIRPRLTRADVESVIHERLGAEAEVLEHEEFTDGFFNAVHAVALADGRRLVVKVAPDPDLKLLRYEKDLMLAEAEFFERAAEAGVPVPKVWHADRAAGVMIMDRLSGASLPKAKESMTRPELLALRREIGALSARIGAIEGSRFGYPRRSGRTMSDRWSTSFLSMVDDVLADAEEFGAELPRPAAAIRETVAGHRSLLDEVDRPSLVHFDLWDGNVFVERTDVDWRVEGVIDGERAFYGDPLAELVSLLFVSEEEAAAVFDGYLGREPTAEERRRLLLYQVYLWLILVVECEVRGFDSE
jgi:aminoglycoside phosphotransferase (APT) family kinase protein